MTSSTLQPRSRGALNRVLPLLWGIAVAAGPAWAQDESTGPEDAPAVDALQAESVPTEPSAESAPADPAPADAAAPADATAATEPAPETIPVEQQAEAPPAAQPSKRPYTFAATRLRHTEFDEAAEDGFGVDVSYQLLPNVFAVGGIFTSESDDARGTESTQYEVGGGWFTPVGDATDLNLVIRLVQRDVNSEPQSQVKMGIDADVGVRTDLTPRLEGSLAARYSESSRLTRAYLTGAALFAVTPSLSLGADASVSTNSTAFGLVGRWAF